MKRFYHHHILFRKLAISTVPISKVC
jgi:hypothetical protein